MQKKIIWKSTSAILAPFVAIIKMQLTIPPFQKPMIHLMVRISQKLLRLPLTVVPIVELPIVEPNIFHWKLLRWIKIAQMQEKIIWKITSDILAPFVVIIKIKSMISQFQNPMIRLMVRMSQKLLRLPLTVWPILEPNIFHWKLLRWIKIVQMQLENNAGYFSTLCGNNQDAADDISILKYSLQTYNQKSRIQRKFQE